MRRIWIFLAPVFWCAAAFAADAPEIALQVGGNDRETFSARHPLLLAVTLSGGSMNEAVRSAQNTRVMRAFASTPEFAAMSEAEKKALYDEYPAGSSPAIRVGDKGPVSRLVRFVVRDASGKESALAARPLKVSLGFETPLQLSPRSPAYLYFGVEPGTLEALPEGDYTLTAVFDTRSERSGWKGGVVSEASAFKLTRGDAKIRSKMKDPQAYEDARLHLLDENWTEVLRLADALIAGDVKSPEGWSLKGDAFAGQGRRDEALAAFGKALDYGRERLPKKSEEPVYIVRRIQRLQDEAKQK